MHKNIFMLLIRLFEKIRNSLVKQCYALMTLKYSKIKQKKYNHFMENILNKSYINNEHGKLLTSSIAYKQEYYILMVGNF